MNAQTLSENEQPVTKTRAGSPGPTARTELAVRGMTCHNCARHVTEAIQRVPGVATADVRLEEGRASVRWAAQTQANIPAVLQSVAKEGFQAEVLEPAEEGHCHEEGEHRKAGWQLNLWIGVLGTAPLMLGEWV